MVREVRVVERGREWSVGVPGRTRGKTEVEEGDSEEGRKGREKREGGEGGREEGGRKEEKRKGGRKEKKNKKVLLKDLEAFPQNCAPLKISNYTASGICFSIP